MISAYLQPSTLVMMILSLSRDLLSYYTIELARVSTLISVAEFSLQRNKEM